MSSRIIDVNGKEIKLEANGATPHIYKQIFHKDLFKIVPNILNIFSERGISLSETMKAAETWNELESDDGKELMLGQADAIFPALSVAIEAGLPELLEEVAFVMNMQSERPLRECLQLNSMNFIEWIKEFPPNAFLMKFTDIGGLYFENFKTTSKEKNIIALQ